MATKSKYVPRMLKSKSDMVRRFAGLEAADAGDETSVEHWEWLELKRQLGPRLFIGLFPAGIVYADRWMEQHRDYKRLGFLPYDDLRLQVAPDCPEELAVQIRADAGQYKAGQVLQVSTAGQTMERAPCSHCGDTTRDEVCCTPQCEPNSMTVWEPLCWRCSAWDYMKTRGTTG